MASAAPITGVPAGAPPVVPTPVLDGDILTAFEDVSADFSNLEAVVLAASNEVGPDGISLTGISLIEAARYMLKHLQADFSGVIAHAYAIRQEAH